MPLPLVLARPRAALLALALALVPVAASAQDCGSDGAGFHAWLNRFKARAGRHGISERTLARGLDGVTYDGNVIHLDRNQKSFKLSFEEFYARRAGPGLVRRGQALMQTHRATLDRMEKEFGVPPAVVISIWGLETNYGSDKGGTKSIVRSVATLAYDCRRPDFFMKELIGALQIIEKGDMTPAQMKGGWAGEIGQTQFLPSAYVKYAVDYDGDGRRDLVNSIPDVLASTANFLKQHGWQRGQSWLPGSANYQVLREWNKAEVYSRTIAVMSARLVEPR
ncbi:MAG: lytic murein transglycosylase [Hyphomicrobiaceae bacterium]|nr:lytic murein transglycosylase [Hyphomicrobiaceae bacterium]